MPVAEDEALACLNVLIAMAKADGSVTADEKKSLAAALGGFELPSETSVERLLCSPIDVDAELAKITSDDAKVQLYRSAHFLANADGVSAPEERALLTKIDVACAPSAQLRAQLAALAPPPTRGARWVSSLRALFRPKT